MRERVSTDSTLFCHPRWPGMLALGAACFLFVCAAITDLPFELLSLMWGLGSVSVIAAALGFASACSLRITQDGQVFYSPPFFKRPSKIEGRQVRLRCDTVTETRSVHLPTTRAIFWVELLFEGAHPTPRVGGFDSEAEAEQMQARLKKRLAG